MKKRLEIFKLFLFLGSRIQNPESGIRIRIKMKPWIRIRIKAYADPKHCLKLR